MAVSPKQLLDAAQELAEGSREVDFRNAASRACYAACHRCRPIVKRTPAHGRDAVELEEQVLITVHGLEQLSSCPLAKSWP